MVLQSLLLIAGFAILVKGADLLVSGASSIARKLNISNLAIGLTVVSLGTSAPELLVNLMSATSGYNDAAFGNILGSNNFNLLLILGVSGIIFPLVVQRKTVQYEVPISIGAILLLFILVNDQMIFGSNSNELSRVDAFLLLAFFGLFMFYIVKTMKSASDFGEGEPIKIFRTSLSVGYIALGIAMLLGGGKLAVENAVSIAEYFGLSQRLIGLTVLAAGTSLPELATSAVAAFRRNTDIAIGNVVGSNIFNICLILGTTGLINPMSYNTALNFDLYIVLAASLVLMIFMFTLGRRKLDRWEAIILFVGYIVYTSYLIGNP
ncbi:MAG TPA: calcium/sodium antiporter [Cyclobacteriaceae bacterium]|nr:calcium/sodium antiporter [Cyclobacteriaceae bacterium]HRK53213.1 calcium/sodium antiporter [Cyclobacteriaceae bacterium]